MNRKKTVIKINVNFLHRTLSLIFVSPLVEYEYIKMIVALIIFFFIKNLINFDLNSLFFLI